MASFSRLETLLSTIASGITGIGLYKDYGIKTPELTYFVEMVGKIRVSADALTPPPLMKGDNDMINDVYSRVIARLPELAQDDIPEEVLEEALKDARELHILLSAVYSGARTQLVSV